MKEKYTQIAERQSGKGDTWKLLSDGKIYSSLTITLDVYFSIVKEHVKFMLDPFGGKLYVIDEKAIEPSPLKYNIYGDQ
jgi:hypothetical protein